MASIVTCNRSAIWVIANNKDHLTNLGLPSKNFGEMVRSLARIDLLYSLMPLQHVPLCLVTLCGVWWH